MSYREKYIELCYEYDELHTEYRFVSEELKEVDEILDNILPVLRKYLNEDTAQSLYNEILFIEE